MSEQSYLQARQRALKAAIAAWQTDLDATTLRLLELTPTPEPPAGPLVTPVDAEKIIDSFGANTHMHYGGVYIDPAKVRDLLQGVGLRHVRDYPVPGSEGAFTLLAQAGIKLSAIMGVPNPPGRDWMPHSLDTLLAVCRRLDALAGISTLEGANEWDINGDPNWILNIRTHMTALKTGAGTMPVIGPSLTWPVPNAPLLGDVGVPWNIHPYPGGVAPELSQSHPLAAEMAACRAVANRAIYATETGYHNQVPSDTGHPGANETQAGVYAPRIVLGNYMAGVVRSFFYELIDEGTSGAEARFGLFRHDFTPKPAALTLRAMVDALHRPGTIPNVTPVPFTITKPADVQHLLIGRRDGTNVVAIWRATDAAAAAVTATVNGKTLQVGPTVQYQVWP